MKLTSTIFLLLSLSVAFLYFIVPSQSSVRKLPQQANAASNLRQVTGAFQYRYYSPHAEYSPEGLTDMPALLRELAEAGLWGASVFLNYADENHFHTDPPYRIGDASGSGSGEPPELLPEIFNFPIAFSFAVYPDLKSLPASQTPLFWTRGLHRHGQDESTGSLLWEASC